MATNLALDDRLIERARRCGRHKTKKEAVTAALNDYIRRHQRLALLKLAGTIEYDPAFDYKRERRRR